MLFLSQLDENSGCSGNFLLPLTYNGEKMKIGIYCCLIVDILTKVSWKCSLSGPLQNIHIYYNLFVCLVTMATKGKICTQKKELKKSSPQKLFGG